MMIAVSGMVGAGKTTVSHHITRCIQDRGVHASVWRFQALPCFQLLRTSLRTRTDIVGAGAPAAAAVPRWRGYRPRRLTATRTFVYLLRILAFRVYRLFWRSGELRVLNRYFYDNFVHFRLSTTSERVYFRLLRSLVPEPDVAFVVTATPHVIASRRPGYDSTYLRELAAGYVRLGQDFPNLIEICTDPGMPALDSVERILSERFMAPR